MRPSAHEFIFADDFSLCGSEFAQNVDGMGVQPYRFAIARQFAAVQVEPEGAEGDLVTIHRIRQKPHGIHNF